jgi:hypothetical protein
MLGNLGPKLYFFRLPYRESSGDELLKQMSEDFSIKIERIETALFEYLYFFEMGPHLIYDNELHKVKWDTESDSVDAKRCIVRLGVLLQHLRCIATVWHTEDSQASEYAYSVSQPEDPRRAITTLRNLARGHALLTGRNYITIEDIPVVVKTVLSTAQIERVSVFYLLINREKGDVSTDDIMDYLHVARPTALRTMAELKAIGLVEDYEFDDGYKTKPVKHIRLRDPFNWFLSEGFKKLHEDFVPVDNTEFLNQGYKQHEKIIKNNYPHTETFVNLSDEQIETFLSIFQSMEKEQANLSIEIDRDTISGEVLRQRLIETGKFQQDAAAMIVEGMCKAGRIEKVSYDTYRRRKE